MLLICSAPIFFLIILPPIILESAYSLHDRAFFNLLGTITVFAVVGTLCGAFLIGSSLYALNEFDMLSSTPLELSFLTCMTFAALISAVDPVAVIALFSQLG